MVRMSEHTVAFTFVEYADSPGGKKRPVVVMSLNGDTIAFYKITSQYENKSEIIRNKYYKIRDWVYANLSRESWVDVNNLIEISKDSLQFTVVGRLSARDIKGLRDFIAREGE